MLDNSKQLVEVMKTVLPVYIDQPIDDLSVVPCITYFLYNDVQDKTGDTLGYSYVTFCVKVWDRSEGSLIQNCIKLDKKLRDLGYDRISSNEELSNNLLCNKLLYKGLSKE